MAGGWGPKAELKLTPATGILMPKQIKKIPNVYGTCIRQTHLKLQQPFYSIIRIFPSFHVT